MSWKLLAVLGVLLGAVVLFVTERVRIDLVALLVLASLLVLGVVSPAEGLSGFASPATVTVAAMFVLTAALEKTGAAAGLGRLLIRSGRGETSTLLLVMLLVGVLSAFVNNTAAVAIFLPLVTMLAAKRSRPPSKLLIPLSYASQFGGVCTLVGSSTNLLVSAISEDAGHGAFSMFEFARAGVFFFLAGTLYFLCFSRWLLPSREPAAIPELYELGEYITELRVAEGSPLVGRTVRESRLGADHDVTVLRLLHGETGTWAPLRQALAVGDVLLVRGKVRDLLQIKGTTGLELNVEYEFGAESLETDDLRLVQALVAPGSPLVGRTLRGIDFRSRFGALVLAVLRRGHPLRQEIGTVRFEVGDALLVQAPEAQIARLREEDGLIVLDQVEGLAPRREKAPLAVGILAAAVVLAALGVLPIVVTAVAGAVAVVLTRCLGLEQAYAAIDTKVVFLLAGILPLGIAMEHTGAARLISEATVGLVGALGPVAVLSAFYLLTAALTEIMSNNATAVLLAPIAISTAERMDVDPRPFLVAVTLAASTSFSTPVGYQTNAMVYNPGGYRYTDFLRAGVPLNLLFWLLATLLVPRFWSF